MFLLDKNTMPKIQRIIEKHFAEMLTQLDKIIDTDKVKIDINLKYDDFNDGFELKMQDKGI